RYSEGTLIEAMQNAWRFVDDEVLRDRLKEAKGIGTPATRAEIIGGLKKQNFLVAQGKNIVPTEIGLQLFGVLKEADPTLVDPGRTAELECLLDDVVIGKQPMVGAVDAVCDVAQRIIGKLTQGPSGDGPPLLGAARAGADAARQPTPAMKRYADVIARQKGIRPPAGYAASAAVCRGFLEKHAPKRPVGEPSGVPGTTGPRKRRRRSDVASTRLTSKKPATGRKTHRAKSADAPTGPLPRPEGHDAGETTPLKIPYGNKEIAFELGARYAAGGWYAPAGVNLAPFRERGWL